MVATLLESVVVVVVFFFFVQFRQENVLSDDEAFNSFSFITQKNFDESAVSLSYSTLP